VGYLSSNYLFFTVTVLSLSFSTFTNAQNVTSNNTTDTLMSEQTSPTDVVLRYTPEENNPPSTASQNQLQNTKSSPNKKLNQQAIAQQLKAIDKLLSQANTIGQSHLIVTAERQLDALPNLDNLPKSSQVNPLSAHKWYIQANILQKRHKFNQALDTLQKIPQTDSRYISAQLMVARIQQIQNKPQAAKSTCTRLFGIAGVQLIQLCVLETQLTLTDAKPQQALENLNSSLKFNDTNTQVSKQWARRLLAITALKKNQPKSAAKWLAENLEHKEIYDWLLWSDIYLTQDPSNSSAQKVYNRIQQHITNIESIEDSIILRLALAEQHLTKQDKTNKFQQLADQRMALRLARNDQLHLADLAYYFLYLKQDKPLALKWAQKNIAISNDFTDQMLLTAAKALKPQQSSQ